MAVPQKRDGRRLLFAGGEFLADFLVVVNGFAGSKILQLEKLTDLDFAFFVRFVGGGNLSGPVDFFLGRLDVDDPRAGDYFPGFGKGAVVDGGFAPGKRDAENFWRGFVT